MAVPTAVAAYLTELTCLLGHASALAGAAVKWKDADLGLRQAQPELLRAHLEPVCVAAQKRNFPACAATCLPDAAWWAARGRCGMWRTCHAQVREYALPVYAQDQYVGTLMVGPYPLAYDGTQTDIERIAQWTADAVGWLSAARSAAILGVRQQQGRHPAVQQALAELLRRPRRDIRIAQVAAAVGISASRLTHLCRSETGRSFSAWRDDAVLAQARRLLARVDLPVAQVAAACGYTNATHFAGSFRRATGMTPSQFRGQDQP